MKAYGSRAKGPGGGAKRAAPMRRLGAEYSSSSKAGIDYKISASVASSVRANSLRKRRDIEQSLKKGIIVKSTALLYNSEEISRVANGIVIIPAVAALDDKGTLSEYNSMNDIRMGVVNLSSECPTCEEINCPGHYGELDLGCQIINPLYVQEVLALMRILCHSCSVPKITALELKKEGLFGKPLKQQLKEIAKFCAKGNRQCISTKTQPEHGTIKQCSRNPILSSESLVEYGVIKAAPSNEKGKASGAYKPMSINDIYKVINGMSLESCQLLGFGTTETVIPPGTAEDKMYAQYVSHPVNMLMTKLVISPNISRPAVREGNKEAPDLITHKLNEIAKATRGEVASRGKNKVVTADGAIRETSIYQAVRELYFSSQDKKVRGHEFQGVVQRIQGKEAIIRKNGMGKQNNFCGRGVAGNNPGKGFGWLGLPRKMEKTLTTSVTVNERNRDKLVNLMTNGRIVSINPWDRDTTITWSPGKNYTLRLGDKVNRWSQEGDWIMNNRQPSLHGTSMMAARIYFHDGETIVYHLSNTTPFNLDFDGDETNVWKPQSPETVQECIELLAMGRNIMSVEKSMPVMGMVMNSVTAFYELCRMKDIEVSEVLYDELVQLMTQRGDFTTLSERLERYGVKARSGAGIVSLLFPPDFYYSSGDVVILEGVLVSGRVKKNHVGTSRNSIIQVMHKMYGPDRTSDFFTDAPFLMNKFIMEHGFTIGMSDCITIRQDEEGGVYDANREEMKREVTRITAMVKGMGGPVADPVAEGIRLRNISQQTDAAKAVGQKLANKMLTEDNAFAIQSELHAGTKGNTANIGAVMGCIGQQYYKGKRLQATISGGRRTLPTFDLDDNSPEAHGFVASSYIGGVTPSGFMFVMMGSREGQLDTANEVQKTGTIQHRMIKAGENTIVDADNSLRNNEGVMFMPLYNNGFNPAAMMPAKMRGRDVLTPFNLGAIISKLNAQRGWVEPKTAKAVEARVHGVPASYKPQLRKATETPEATGVEHREISKYEKARLLSVRAEMLDNGATPLVAVAGDFDPHAIAEEEYKAGVIPLFVIRKYPDGSFLQLHPDPTYVNRVLG